MKLQVVGIQRQDYKLESGYEFHGQKIYCIDKSSFPNGLEGNQVTSFKLPDGAQYTALPLKIDTVYSVFFDQKGNIEDIFLK